MSFILEALKRSENQRQRETGPGLATAPVSEEGRRRPPWLAIAAALLILNLAVLAFMLYRPSPETDSTQNDPGPGGNPPEVARPNPTPAAIRPAPAVAVPPLSLIHISEPTRLC